MNCCFSCCFPIYKKRTYLTNSIIVTPKLRSIQEACVANKKPFFQKQRKSKLHIRSNSPHNNGLYELKDQFRCLFCRGKNCPHEDYTKHKNPAIIGLHSDLIDNCVYASQRPSNVLIKRHNLIKQFKEKSISLIVNLQIPGEHPYCGPNKLDPLSGYSYNPALFSSEGITVLLNGWKDMDVPDSLLFMLDIVKEMVHVVQVERKRVLVHCHAGYGRTGVVIACYKIFSENISAEDAVKQIRAVRPKCIEARSQFKYCVTFRQFITRLYEIFPQDQYDVNVFLKHQNDVAPKAMQLTHTLLYIPQLISTSLLRILELKSEMHIEDEYVYKALNGGFDVSDEKYAQISNIMLEINENNWNSLKLADDIIIIAELLFIWMDECVRYCISPKSIEEIFKDEGGEEFSNNITEQLLDHKNQTQEEKQFLNLYIKRHMKKYEYEILKYYALFLKEISPNPTSFHDNQSLILEYEHMTEKIAIFLLGYNIDTLFEREYQLSNKASFDDTNNVNIFDSVQNLIILLEFFQSLSKYTLTEEHKYIQLNEEVTNQLNKQKRMGSHWSVDRSPVFENNNNNRILGKKGNFNLSYNGNVIRKVNSKEKKLYDIYSMLKQHFKSKDKNAYNQQSENELRKRISTLAKEINHSSQGERTVIEEDKESSMEKKNGSGIKSNNPTEGNVNMTEQEVILDKMRYPSVDVRQVKRSEMKRYSYENRSKRCECDDWFNMKRKSKGVSVLDKKRKPGILKYKFSLRRGTNHDWNKSKISNGNEVNEIMKKQGLFPKFGHNKHLYINDNSTIPEVLKIKHSNVVKLTNNNMIINKISVLPHSCSELSE